MDSTSATPDATAYRVRYWSELTDAERIERLRSVIKAQTEQLSDLASRVRALEEHGHAHGQLVVPLHHEHLGISQKSVLPDEEWI